MSIIPRVIIPWLLLGAAASAQTLEAPADGAPASATATAAEATHAPPRVFDAERLAADPALREAFEAAHAAPDDLFERVAVLGASVTYGHGLSKEVGQPVGFAEVFDAALLGEHGRVHAHGDWFFFNRSLSARAEMVARAREREPTLLVAPDFLFWYAYGQVSEEGMRAWMFGKALELLDAFPGTVLVGDLPWLEGSVGRTDGFLPGLQPYQLPERETVDALNARLHEWARARPRVAVVPLARFVEQLLEGEPIAVGDDAWDAGGPERLLQPDWLHPTLEGSSALAVLCLEVLREARPGWDVARMERDVDRVVARVLGDED